MSANLVSAKSRLANPPIGKPEYPLEDLPDISDPLWVQIQTDYELSVPELGALKKSLGKLPYNYTNLSYLIYPCDCCRYVFFLFLFVS